jgi:GTP-binding protein
VDLLSQTEIKKAKEAATHSLHFAVWTPIVALSAKTGHGVAQLMKEVTLAGQRMKKRIPTSEINRFFERIIQEHPPPTRGGKAPRIY